MRSNRAKQATRSAKCAQSTKFGLTDFNVHGLRVLGQLVGIDIIPRLARHALHERRFIFFMCMMRLAFAVSIFITVFVIFAFKRLDGRRLRTGHESLEHR